MKKISYYLIVFYTLIFFFSCQKVDLTELAPSSYLAEKVYGTVWFPIDYEYSEDYTAICIAKSKEGIDVGWLTGKNWTEVEKAAGKFLVSQHIDKPIACTLEGYTATPIYSEAGEEEPLYYIIFRIDNKLEVMSTETDDYTVYELLEKDET